MKLLSTLMFCFLATSLYGQDRSFIFLKPQSDVGKNFAQEGWVVTDSVFGYLNGDGFTDIVFVLRSMDSVLIKDADGYDIKILPRVLAVGLGSQNGQYQLAETNDQILANYNSPPIHSPPFLSMSIVDRQLTLEFSFDYINGNFNFYTYKFSYDKSEFVLVEVEVNYTRRNDMSFEEANFQFLNKKWSRVAGDYPNDKDLLEPIENTQWFRLTVPGLRPFRAMGPPGMWEVVEGVWL
jgi:hypothetical protein